MTSLRTFTFKSFSRCPLHYSTTKTSLCGFLENLKNPFVPHPLLSFSSLPNPFPRRVFARPLLILRCRCKTFREIPSIILVHALALWPRYESSHESELFGFATHVFLTSVPYSIFRIYTLSRLTCVILVSTEWVEISTILPNFCNSILSLKKLGKVDSVLIISQFKKRIFINIIIMNYSVSYLSYLKHNF